MRSIILLSILALMTSLAFAQDPNRGTCIGSDKLGLDVRMANEASCKTIKTVADCKKEMVKCNWQPEEMACIAINDEKTEDMKTCTTITRKGDCDMKKSLCKWGYKEKSCHAKDQNSKEDMDSCENHDSNESACNQSSKCVWGVF